MWKCINSKAEVKKCPERNIDNRFVAYKSVQATVNNELIVAFPSRGAYGFRGNEVIVLEKMPERKRRNKMFW